METITSRENGQVRELAGLLARKKDRDESGLFAAEGLRLCADAAGSGVPLRKLFLTREALGRYPEAKALAERAERVLYLGEALAQRISDTKAPQGVFCIAPKLDNGAQAVKIKKNGLYLLLSSLQDPGNLGSILRTAEALGVDGAVLIRCPDLYSPKVLRASMGGVFRLPIWLCGGLEEPAARLREAGLQLCAAAPRPSARSIAKADFSRGGAVLIGNEGAGLAQAELELCTGMVSIPMRGGAESLGAAAAASILIWEMTGGRREG